MSDFNLVDPRGWEYDLQSVYAAYMGYFQLHNIPWYERTWAHLFESFEAFLAFSWPVITVTDAHTCKPHIVTRMTSIGAFLKMIKTRFGETLASDTIIATMRLVQPFETSPRHLRNISDLSGYKKVHGTLNAIVLSALKTRVRAGEVEAVRSVWEARDKTFMSMNFEWSERNEKSCLEFGYATMRCGHLDALGVWPPVPEANYRKGHYIVSEYVDKVFNKHCPTYPWQYAFGESQVVPKVKLPLIVQSIFSSLVGPDSETTANSLVLVGHGIYSDLHRLDEMKIKIPHNLLIIDTASFERALFAAGARGPMQDREPKMAMSLPSMLTTLLPKKNAKPYPDVQAHNTGNDAFMSLLAAQLLLDPEGTKVPDVKKKPSLRGQSSMPMNPNGAGMGMNGMNGMMVYPSPYMSMPNMAMNAMMTGNGQLSPQLSPGLSSQGQSLAQQRAAAMLVANGQLSPGLSSQTQSRSSSQGQLRSSSQRPRSGAQGVDGLTPPDELGGMRSHSANGTRNGRLPGRASHDAGNGEGEGKRGMMGGGSATLGAMARKSALPLR